MEKKEELYYVGIWYDVEQIYFESTGPSFNDKDEAQKYCDELNDLYQNANETSERPYEVDSEANIDSVKNQ